MIDIWCIVDPYLVFRRGFLQRSARYYQRFRGNDGRSLISGLRLFCLCWCAAASQAAGT
jgi:hypothetical protein